MLYTQKNIKEFYVQMKKKTLEKGLIRASKGSYSSPVFMVMNEAEKQQIKARMDITYKRTHSILKN